MHYNNGTAKFKKAVLRDKLLQVAKVIAVVIIIVPLLE
jgi:hypothetical protein